MKYSDVYDITEVLRLGDARIAQQKLDKAVREADRVRAGSSAGDGTWVLILIGRAMDLLRIQKRKLLLAIESEQTEEALNGRR